MRIAMVQSNPTVGDVEGNTEALMESYRQAVDRGADLVATGELALTGYPPDDLLLRPAFMHAVDDALARLATTVDAVPLVVGAPMPTDPESAPAVDATISEAVRTRRLSNAAVVVRAGGREAVYRKRRIPNYGVFDEARYFLPVDGPVVIDVAGTLVGLTVCEDLWGAGGPVEAAGEQGAEVVLNLNASPYHQGKRDERESWARRHARAAGVWLIYVNLVGGQDDVVFDGDSFALDPSGTVVARGSQFTTDLVIVDFGEPAPEPPPRLTREAEVYDALVLATRDYLGKNGFTRAVVGVSGGIDSAVTAAVAVDALGPDHVTGVAMPSPHSSRGSLTDARDLLAALGARYLELPLAPAMTGFDEILAEPFGGTEPGVAEENIQSRSRGIVLMALSNKGGDIVLATGNKSEYAVGYATLYGDMCGGFAPLKDVYKTLVFDIARYRNTHHRTWWRGPHGVVVPEATISKPPSAELRPDQLDTDSLPDYRALDPILEAYVEGYASVRQIIDDGHDAETVAYVARLVDRAEYKRRQAAPGVKVTSRAFGRDRRLPITNAWRSTVPQE
jgi:NAD+ synthetase